ncbi:uncharacterized protein LOC121836559 [Ixodes scapularis]|uniref:uncharacterized protein LOC121836559 n=1 Tax=Ixodes scapularis TaxID=6945 RepID=UPI001C381780|nr:uncharacterized protein LOC121836559 [Ixodes scapularis]
MLRDQIVYGTSSKKIREKLLRKKDLTLEIAVECCKAEETANVHNKTWNDAAVKGSSEAAAKVEIVKTVKQQQKDKSRCRFCNQAHAPRQCPAYRKTCSKCRKKNHFAVCCKTKQSGVHDVEETSEASSDFDVLEILSTSSVHSVGNRDWTVNTTIEGKQVELKVDTGAQANLLPRTLFMKIKQKQRPQHTTATLHSYGGGIIQHLGKVRLSVSVGRKQGFIDFFIVKKGRQAIMGLKACEHFGLVNRVNTVEHENQQRQQVEREFPGLFRGLGCTKRAYKMVLRDNSTPVIQPARRVAHALRAPLKAELDRMETAGVIAKAPEPSDWFVPGKKLVIADTLSRISGGSQAEDDTTDVEIHANAVFSTLVGSRTLGSLQAATAGDPVLQEAIASLEAGTPVRVSSPGYPRSNGLAEKGVQVVKRLLRKAQSTKEDFWLGLLSYRTAPLEGGRSPSELLMGRGIRSLLPDFSSDPAPPVQKHTQNLKKGRHLEPLQPGDTVRILNDGKWATKATVESYVAPRSYSVVTEDGRTFRRNRQHLLKVDEDYDSRTTEENDDSESEDDGGPQSPGPDGTDEETEDQEAPQPQTQQGPSSRRAGRSRQPPRRLSYDESFQQMP